MNTFYEIHSGTLAIVPLTKEKSEILEDQNRQIVFHAPLSIVDYSCRYFGSSYMGRFEGSKSLLKTRYKNPIIVEESREFIFFPTHSPRLSQCAWISLQNVKDYFATERGVMVRFKNDVEKEFDISYHSFENQYFRATRLLVVLQNQKNAIK